jgi:hypothetical protein
MLKKSQGLSNFMYSSTLPFELHGFIYSVEFLLFSEVSFKSLLSNSLSLVEPVDCSLTFATGELLGSSSMIELNVSCREYSINPTPLIPNTKVAR